MAVRTNFHGWDQIVTAHLTLSNAAVAIGAHEPLILHVKAVRENQLDGVVVIRKVRN